MIEATRVRTDRLDSHVLVSGDEGEPVLFIHGNLSSSVFWRQALTDLAPRRAYAVDLRGFGASDPLGVDATRGLADYADDVAALVDALAIGPVHLVGWSMGGGVGWTVLRDRPELVRSLVLVNPVSPYGYGGTVDEAGTLAFPDNAGCGAGATNPEFVQRLRDGDRSDESPFSPLSVLRSTYVLPPFRAPDEAELLESVLASVIGEDNYPGDGATSPHWPGVAPGDRGVLNTMARDRMALAPVLGLPDKPPVLWIRGDSDVIVSDAAALDLANLGKLGVLPDWPGDSVSPPQPMVGQTREFLRRYGPYEEVVIAGTGHAPHIEKPAEFAAALSRFLDAH